MIIRILADGQYDVPDAELRYLNALDAELQAAADARDDARFGDVLDRLLGAVREAGSRVPDAVLTSSDLVLPARGTGLAEVTALLSAEGLIPG